MISISVLSSFSMIAMPGLGDRHAPDWVIVFSGIRKGQEEIENDGIDDGKWPVLIKQQPAQTEPKQHEKAVGETRYGSDALRKRKHLSLNTHKPGPKQGVYPF